MSLEIGSNYLDIVVGRFRATSFCKRGEQLDRPYHCGVEGEAAVVDIVDGKGN